MVNKMFVSPESRVRVAVFLTVFGLAVLSTLVGLDSAVLAFARMVAVFSALVFLAVSLRLFVGFNFMRVVAASVKAAQANKNVQKVSEDPAGQES